MLKDQIKELRKSTGAGILNCKKALIEGAGDMDKAKSIIKEKGQTALSKKVNRLATEGLVKSYIRADKKVGSLVEVNCETDFVAENQIFKDYVALLCREICKEKFDSVDSLLKGVKDDQGLSLEELLLELNMRFGEKIVVRRFSRLEANTGALYKYSHAGGKIACLMAFNSCDEITSSYDELSKEIAMQVIANNPKYIQSGEISKEDLASLKTTFLEETLESNKAAHIIDRIVDGKLSKHLKNICLYDQSWIKNKDMTVEMMIKKMSDDLNIDYQLLKISRFEKGQGVKKI